jgi:hypothetical protein
MLMSTTRTGAALLLLLAAAAGTATALPSHNKKHRSAAAAAAAARNASARGRTAQPRQREDFFEVTELPETLGEFSPWYSRYVNVFGIHIVATPGSRFTSDYWTTPFDDDTLLYAANIMAQWIDNNEDGLPDDPRIIESMINENALLYMTPTDSEPESDEFFDDWGSNRPSGYGMQFLHGEETVRYPSIPVPPGTRFDACPEETQHLVNNYGHVKVYPEIFGRDPGSIMTANMERIIGGTYALPCPRPSLSITKIGLLACSECHWY